LTRVQPPVSANRIDDLPGYRRRLRVTPSNGRVLTELEDDYHCMAVTVHHDGHVATAVEPVMDRAPWSTCPGAVAVLEQTFVGVALRNFASRGEKRANCTHLHDLAVLAAAHAFDTASTVFDILVADPVAGRSEAELRRNGIAVLDWRVVKGRIIAPAPLAGLDLDNMRSWIESLDPDTQEAARLLRWGTMVAHGRTLPADWASGTGNMASGSRCFTFQPHKVGEAKHVGAIRDFSRGVARPLDSASPAPRDTDLFHVTRDHASRSFAGRRTS
jgi:Protein of unknown function (DUF2889)